MSCGVPFSLPKEEIGWQILHRVGQGIGGGHILIWLMFLELLDTPICNLSSWKLSKQKTHFFCEGWGPEISIEQCFVLGRSKYSEGPIWSKFNQLQDEWQKFELLELTIRKIWDKKKCIVGQVYPGQCQCINRPDSLQHNKSYPVTYLYPISKCLVP